MTDVYACCLSALTIENVEDARTIYLAAVCGVVSGGSPLSDEPGEVCGACTGPSTVVPGWECATPLVVGKRFATECPPACENATFISAVAPDAPPAIGECASFVDHCVGTSGGDGEQCCLAVGA